LITPRFLSAAADQMMKLYAELETDIKADMCRRLAKLGQVTDATEWQAKILKEIGGLTSDINKELAKYDKATQKQVKALFQSLVEKNVPDDISDNQKQMMAATAGYQSLITDLSNLTRTSTATTEFITEANSMYMKTASGAFSYDQAIKDAVDNMASKGLTTLQYGNRAHSLESIARTCVLTTLGQTAGQQSLANAQDTGTDLVMVSAHEGARHTDNPPNPWSNHDEWQGKVYCLNGERDWTDSEGNVHHAENLAAATGYGEVDGLCGINCRHTFYPFYEGEDPRYEDKELKEYTEKNLTLDGRPVSRYEAEQELRRCERGIRAWKRKADCQAAAGLDNTAARHKIGLWQAERLRISKETGIPPDYSREYIGTVAGKQIRGLKSGGYDMTPAEQKESLKLDITKAVDAYNVSRHQLARWIKTPSKKEIIGNLGGPDLTRGSCSSLAMAYAANKGGWQVVDFRGGVSQEVFSRRSNILSVTEIPGVTSYVEKALSDFKGAAAVLDKAKVGKEYYFACGAHAAVVRRLDAARYQYLELQDDPAQNGFKDLTKDVLKVRFGAKNSRTYHGRKVEVDNILIDIDTLKSNNIYLNLMECINTPKGAQKKGAGGGVR